MQPEIKVTFDMIKNSEFKDLLDFNICKNNLISLKFWKVQSDVWEVLSKLMAVKQVKDYGEDG